MKIYTRTGDAGGTALFGGQRVSKADPRVAAYGDVDELNACLGAVRAQSELAGDVATMLEQLQKDLFAIGARLADPAEKIADRVTKVAVTDADVQRLEDWIDRFEGELPPLRCFILPGGNRAGVAISPGPSAAGGTPIVALGAE
jgi:cob(I)alamin adenosyltransferase